MDTLTHALSGLLIGRATSSKTTKIYKKRLSLRARLLAGFFAAAFPDIDIIARFFGTLNYLEMHRGITHSIIMLPIWALLISVVYAKISRNYYHWKDFYLISLFGVGIHIAGDVITAYGTMVFAPFSIYKLAWPTTFIIDFYFTGIILIAIIFAFIFRNKGQHIAVAGFACLLSYIGYQGILSQQAGELAEKYSKENKIINYKISVMPQPFSPYHWKAIIKTDEVYQVGYIDLMSKNLSLAGKDASIFAKVDALYRPVNQVKWTEINQYGELNTEQVKQVWNLDIMKPIRRFMLYPSLANEENMADGCVWFKDLRFVLDGVRQSPFKFGACKDENKDWQLFRLDNNVKVSMFN